VIVDRIGDEHAARLGQPLQPRRYIDPVSENVPIFGNHVTEVHSDAEPDPPFLGNLTLAIGHPVLDLHGTADGINDARELGQRSRRRYS
jgi:hypothetical protein